MKLLVLLFSSLLSLQAFAQSGEIPKPVLDDLAKDLAQLHQAVVDAQRRQQEQGYYVKIAGGSRTGTNEITVTRESTAVRAGAIDSAMVLMSAKKNQTFRVIDKVDEWYAVALPEETQGVSAGWVKADDAVPTFPFNYLALSEPDAYTNFPSGQPPTSLAGNIFRELTEKAVRFRDTYRDNPYISVTGFSVNVGVPPSVSISFEFKN